jgi:hypothetical protein
MKFLAIALSIWFSSCIVNAQNLKSFTFKGQVHAYGEKCKGALIYLMEKGQVVDSTETGGNGKFQIEVNAEREYMIKVSKKGMKTKTIWVNTKRTQELKHKLPNFEFDVYLKKDKNDEYAELNELPVALIKYQPNRKAFYMDDDYEDVIDRKKDRIKEKKRYRPRPK